MRQIRTKMGFFAEILSENRLSLTVAPDLLHLRLDDPTAQTGTRIEQPPNGRAGHADLNK